MSLAPKGAAGGTTRGRLRVAINGFGRIGRQVAQVLLASGDGPELVAVNTGRSGTD